LREAIHDKDNFRLEIGRRIYCYPLKMLKQDDKLRGAMEHLLHEKETNPLQFFMPNGKCGLDFLNDHASTLKMIVAGNRYGKTCLAMVDMLLDLVPCNPEWLIFKENGVKFRPYDGVPKSWGCANYMWRHISTANVPLILQWTPDLYLGKYAQTAKSRKEITDKKPYVELTHGAKIQFFVYEQDQEPFESSALKGWVWDEQPPEAKFDGADERTRTLNGRHIVSMTPHRVKGRPDTGAGTWLHKVWNNGVTKGHTIGKYKAHTFDNPDWNYSEIQKRRAFVKHVVEPERHHDRKRIDEGRSRLGGEFHEASGLVYDDLCRDIHIIQQFEIPKHWTRYRAIDHGHKNPTSCVYAAVTPENDIIIYDEYYKAGLTVYPNAKAIADKAGNSLDLVERRSDFGGNTDFDVYEEVQYGTRFERTVLDGRSFAFGDPMTGLKYGDLYKNAGIDVTPARGGDHTVKGPIVAEYLVIDYGREHLITKQKGAPRCYITDNCVMLIEELFSYTWQEEKETATGISAPKPRKGNDHAVNAMEYLLMDQPVYRGDITQSDIDRFMPGSGKSFLDYRIEESEPRNFVNSITGY
jgi:phage terminase large subunit-like protein